MALAILDNLRGRDDKAVAQTVETEAAPEKEWGVIVQGAKEATDLEHSQGILEAVRVQWKGVAWASFLSLSIAMYGYDNALINNFYGYPAFQKAYGIPVKDGYQVPAKWQTGLSQGSICGIILGATFNGFLSSRFGYKRVMLAGLVLMTGFVAIPFSAQNLETLLVGEIFCGMVWGTFASIGPAYSSECLPISLRGFLTSGVNIMQIIGQLIAIGVLDGLVGLDSQWSYRIPFAIQWVWPLPLFIGCLFAPESPWYLVRKGRIQEAEHSIRRLSSKSDTKIKEHLAMIIHTVNYEEEIRTGSSYIDLFRGSNLRRTEICCMAFAGQVFNGIFMMNPGTYFWEQAGLSAKNSYKVSVAATAIGLLATAIGCVLIAHLGRRSLYLWGMVFMTIVNILIGILATVHANESTKWGQVALTILWVFCYDISVGPAAYATSSEVSAISLRVQSVAAAKIAHQLFDIIAAVLEPYMINPTAWGWAGKTAYFWGGTSVLVTVWAFFRYPETFKRSYEELDILFERGISARKFRKYEVDAYDIEGEKIHEKTG
ncbi:sugar transporter domain-containing protein [Trichoderma breve]|uniref:Sugar transporter domain-containing protein n=1 Tax=Trichoderma breve TaxID=2034170 RepID=A0A9W9E8Q3_9HYPO|nr:sugar transporter domain-containing protein [Trichoderma breve]KAJ4860662.1 sugar transporter domain-containing protein [Trichoderma breve]